MRIDLPFLDKVIQNILILLAAALAVFFLVKYTSYFNNYVDRVLRVFPYILTKNTHRTLLIVCLLYVISLIVWWFWWPPS